MMMKSKILSKSNIIKVSTTLILVLAVLLCGYVLLQVIQKGYVSFGPYSAFRVVTGSMEPTLPISSLLLCKAVDIEEIRVGDIVCFRSYGITENTAVITHRVTAVLTGESGEVLLQTKGDANLVADGVLVNQRNFIGKVTAHLGDKSALANVMNFLTGKTGFILCIGMPTLLIAGMILQSCASNIKDELKKVVDDLATVDEPEAPAAETYEQMQERIRQELLLEMQLNQPPELTAEEPAEAEETSPESETAAEPETEESAELVAEETGDVPAETEETVEAEAEEPAEPEESVEAEVEETEDDPVEAEISEQQEEIPQEDPAEDTEESCPEEPLAESIEEQDPKTEETEDNAAEDPQSHS